MNTDVIKELNLTPEQRLKALNKTKTHYKDRNYLNPKVNPKTNKVLDRAPYAHIQPICMVLFEVLMKEFGFKKENLTTKLIQTTFGMIEHSPEYVAKGSSENVGHTGLWWDYSDKGDWNRVRLINKLIASTKLEIERHFS